MCMKPQLINSLDLVTFWSAHHRFHLFAPLLFCTNLNHMKCLLLICTILRKLFDGRVQKWIHLNCKWAKNKQESDLAGVGTCRHGLKVRNCKWHSRLKRYVRVNVTIGASPRKKHWSKTWKQKNHYSWCVYSTNTETDKETDKKCAV